MREIIVSQCSGEGQGSCKRCEDKGKWNRIWMSLLSEIAFEENGNKTTLEGCYCSDCVKEIEKEWQRGGKA